MTVFSLTDVTASYGSVEVLHKLNFSIDKGEMVTVIGANGAGKSTLLSVMAGQHRGYSGRVVFQGQRIDSFSASSRARAMAWMPQWETHTTCVAVEDYVMMGRLPHRGSSLFVRREDREAVEEAMEMAGLMDLRQRYLDELSGGERQRAAIALALAQNREVLLLDEPVSSLDIHYAQEVMELLEKMNRSGTTILIALHDINLASLYSQRLLALKNGALLFDGKPQEQITVENLKLLYGVKSGVFHGPAGVPVVYPLRDNNAEMNRQG